MAYKSEVIHWYLLIYVPFFCYCMLIFPRFQEKVRLKQKRSRCYNPFSRLLHTPCTHHTMTSSWPPPITGNIIEPAPQFFTEAGNVSWFFPPQGARHWVDGQCGKPFLYSRRCQLEKTRTSLLSKSNYKSSFTLRCPVNIPEFLARNIKVSRNIKG